MHLPTDHGQCHTVGERAGQRRDGRGTEIDDAVHRDRSVESLQGPLAGGFERHAAPPLRECPHDVGGEDLARPGERLQPSGLDDRDTVVIAVVDEDLTDRQPDADLEHRDGRCRRAVRGHCTLDGDRGAHGIRRVGEDGLDPVAGPPENLPVVLVDRSGEQPVVGLAQLLGAPVAESGPKLGGRHHVREQDRRGGHLRGHAGAAYSPGRKRLAGCRPPMAPVFAATACRRSCIHPTRS